MEVCNALPKVRTTAALYIGNDANPRIIFIPIAIGLEQNLSTTSKLKPKFKKNLGRNVTEDDMLTGHKELFKDTP